MAPKTAKQPVASKAPVSAGKSPAPASAAPAGEKEAGKKTVTGVEKKKKRTASKRGRWETYIVKLLKQVHPDTGISKKAVNILNSFIDDTLDRLCAQCAVLLEKSKKRTVKPRDVRCATGLILPGELARHAAADATVAVQKAQH